MLEVYCLESNRAVLECTPIESNFCCPAVKVFSDTSRNCTSMLYKILASQRFEDTQCGKPTAMQRKVGLEGQKTRSGGQDGEERTLARALGEGRGKLDSKVTGFG